MKEQTVETLGALAVYAALYFVWNAAGGSFHVWPDLWQLMPWPALASGLGGAMLDLHSQPPLLNLIFGAALKVSIATGISMESLLQPLYFLLGAGAVVALVGLARHLVARRGVRVAVVLLFLANPYLYASLHYLFYTPIELLLLLLGGWLGFRFLDGPSPGRLAAALGPALLLVYARSMFHPLWLLLLIGLLLGLARPRLPVSRAALVGGTALAIAFAWPAKNLARFGFFGFSSWSGMSIARGLPTGEPLLPSGYQARLGAFARTSNEPPVPGSIERAARMVPPEFRHRPALAAVSKPDGSPNWNHYALIPLSRELGAAALVTLREQPSLLFMKAADFYANGFAIYEARWPYRDGYSPEMTTGHRWARIYEAVVFQPLRAYDPSSTGITTGFAIVFPLVLLAVLVLLWRRRRSWDPADRTVVLLLFSIGWVLAMIVFVDGPEGNRVRFSTEPLLFLVAGWLTGGKASGRAGVEPPSRPDGEPA